MNIGRNDESAFDAPPLRIAAYTGLSEELRHKARHKPDWRPHVRSAMSVWLDSSACILGQFCAHGGPYYAVPEGQDGVKAYRGTVSLARLFHEALVILPVARVLRVEFVGRAVFLQSLLWVVLVLKSDTKGVMGAVIVRVEA